MATWPRLDLNIKGQIQSICIVRLSALGDVLMVVPLIRTIQAQLPKVTISWVISPPAYALVEGMPGVSFIVIEKPQHLKDYWRFRKRMRTRRFDVLLATQASLRANLLYPLIRAKHKIGYDTRRAKDGHQWFIDHSIQPGNDHTVDGFLKFALALGLKKQTASWDLPIQAEDYQWAHTHLPAKNGLTVLINPAASKAERCWPIERWIALINHVQNRWQAQVIITGGPTARDTLLAETIMAQTVNVIDLAGKTQPKQLLALIAAADLLICPDTGPAHMAAAVNTPVIALHAVTNPDISGPYGFRHLAVNYYPEAVRKILRKTPENIPWGTQVHGSNAMELIPVSAVIVRVDKVLAGLTKNLQSHR